MGNVGQGVVLEHIGEHLVLVIDQVHVARELGLFGVQLVTSILGLELGIVAVIDDSAAVEVVAHVGVDFIVQRIGQQCSAAVLETYVAAQFGHTLFAIVVEHVAINP